MHLPFGAAALPETNPGALTPSMSLEPEKAKSDTSESSPPAKKQTMAETIGQANKERSNHTSLFKFIDRCDVKTKENRAD